MGLTYPANVITELKVNRRGFVKQFDALDFFFVFIVFFFQHVDTWSFNVFALNEASGDHALKFVFYELLTRYDLIHRFKVRETSSQCSGRTAPAVLARPTSSLLLFVLRGVLQVPIPSLMSFISSLEVGYSKYKNPYHNLVHAADVTQTIHHLLLKTGIVVRVCTLKVTATQ